MTPQSDPLNEKLKAHQMKDNGLAVEVDRHPPLVLPAEDVVLSDLAASCPPRSIAAPSNSGGTSWEPREELDRPHEGLMDPFDVGSCQRYEYGVSQEESGPRLEQRRASGKGGRTSSRGGGGKGQGAAAGEHDEHAHRREHGPTA